MENGIMMPEVKEPERQESQNKKTKWDIKMSICSALSTFIFHKNYGFTKKSLEENLNRKGYSYFHQIKHSQNHNYIIGLGVNKSSKVILIDKNKGIENEYQSIDDLKANHKYGGFIFTRIFNKIFENIDVS